MSCNLQPDEEVIIWLMIFNTYLKKKKIPTYQFSLFNSKIIDRSSIFFFFNFPYFAAYTTACYSNIIRGIHDTKKKKKITLTLTLRDQTSRERASREEKHLKHDRSMIRAIVI